MGFKASSSWFLASKGFVLSSTSARALLRLRFKVEKSCEDENDGVLCFGFYRARKVAFNGGRRRKGEGGGEFMELLEVLEVLGF
ncbi:hypothetical protein Tco_0280632 [Tanacetum coccineum]